MSGDSAFVRFSAGTDRTVAARTTRRNATRPPGTIAAAGGSSMSPCTTASSLAVLGERIGITGDEDQVGRVDALGERIAFVFDPIATLIGHWS